MREDLKIKDIQLRNPSESEFLEVAQWSFDNFLVETARSTDQSVEVLKETLGGAPICRSKNDIWFLIESNNRRVGFVWFQINQNEKSAFGWDIYLEPDY